MREILYMDNLHEITMSNPTVVWYGEERNINHISGKFYWETTWDFYQLLPPA